MRQYFQVPQGHNMLIITSDRPPALFEPETGEENELGVTWDGSEAWSIAELETAASPTN